ncbi:MAG: TonB-dependent receptor [Bryobacterales bacterium]|nr:TonB-dependent receptor [Bryobacterales bacterium]
MRLFVFLVMSSMAVLAQTAQVTGRVTDSTSAVVVNASIEVTNVDTGIQRTTVSNSGGTYTLPLLPPGQYTVSAGADGFRTEVRQGITLAVDQTARLDFVLVLGSVAESISVTADAGLVDSSSATVGTVIENRRVSELPLNGRNAMALVMLTPGVKSNAGPTNSGFGDRGTALSSISINGGPSGMNNLMLDGGNNVDSYQMGVNVSPAVDAVQEFKVMANTMSAEHGFTAGGVVNMVTKSGTNELHGTLYEFVRNDKFDARRTFAQQRDPFRYNQFGGAVGGPVVLPRLYNGKERTFFFFNYEEWRFRRYDNPVFTVPIEEQRNGDFSRLFTASGAQIPVFDPWSTRANTGGSGFLRDRFPNNVIPQSRMDPVAQNYLAFYPLPNRAPVNPFTNQLNFAGSNAEQRSMRQYTSRVDHRLGNRNSLFGRYTYYQHYTDGGIGGVLPDPVVRQRIDNWENRNLILSDTHTFTPTLLNEFRAGVARLYFPFNVASFGDDWPQKLGLPAIVPSDTIPAVNNGLPGIVTGTAGLRAATTWQIQNTLTYIRAQHTLKSGFELRIQRANNLQRSAPSGSFVFPVALSGNPQAPAGTGSAFATFLTGAVGNASVTTHLGQAQHGHSLSFFVQDDWRLARRFTLNLGLRYDYQPWPVERYDRVSNFNPFAPEPVRGLPGRQEFAGQDYGRSAIANVKNSFSPRIGFAYSVDDSTTFVIRGGYGIFYPLIFARDYFGNGAGFATTSTAYLPPGGNANLPAMRFSDGFPSAPIQPQGAALGPNAFFGQNVSYTQPNEPAPMTQQWNLGIQKQFGLGWMVDVTYSGSHGTHFLSGVYDYNQLDPVHLALGLALQDRVPNPYEGFVPGALGAATITREQSLRPYPYYNQIGVTTAMNGNYNSHALLMTMQKRFSSGLTLLASFTGGKLINDSVRTMLNFGEFVEQVGIVGYQNGNFDRRLERSLDPTDVSRRLVFSGVYELPFGKGKAFGGNGKVFNVLAGGWQVNSITTLQTGLPLVIRGANNLRADRPNSTGESAKLSNPTADRWFDTNTFVNPPNFTFGNVGRVLPDVRAPGVANVDISLIKRTPIGERARLELRGEAFNAFNRVNLGFPNVSFQAGPDGRNLSAAFGTITSSRDARIIQLGLKLIF